MDFPKNYNIILINIDGFRRDKIDLCPTLKELTEQSYYFPIEALKTATVNPAEYFGLSADYGSIASGKVADLMLLDANPLENISNTAKINKVIFNGNVYTRKELDNMLAYVEGNASSLSMACKLIWQEISE